MYVFSSVWTMEKNSAVDIKSHYTLRHGPVCMMCLRLVSAQYNLSTVAGFHIFSL